MDEEIIEHEPHLGRPAASRYASTALFMGVVALVSSVALIGGLIGIGAIVLGIRGLHGIRASNGALRGKGMAIGGIAFGALSVLASLVALAIYLLFPTLLRPH